MSSEIQRKLTTILAADAAGYSRVMEANEVAAFDALQAARGVFSKFIARHHGRIANTAGDGLIAEFPSVVEAVQCAIEVQQELGDPRNQSNTALNFRIGIHLGDVIVDNQDLLGEGVNLAARLQTMADPGGILISQQVYDQVHAKLSVGFDYLGEKRPKNFSGDVPVYSIARNGKRKSRKAPRAPQVHSISQTAAAPADLQSVVGRRVRLYGVLWLALVVIDLVTGSPFWAHYPGIVMVALLLAKAAPLLTESRPNQTILRGGAIIGGLAAINVATWSGYAWVLWPAGGFMILVTLRYLGVLSR